MCGSLLFAMQWPLLSIPPQPRDCFRSIGAHIPCPLLRENSAVVVVVDLPPHIMHIDARQNLWGAEQASLLS